MSRTIDCSTHSKSRPAYVCQHLYNTFSDGTSAGGVWWRNDEDCIEACCDDCDKRFEAAGGEWVGEAKAQRGLEVICEGCFRRIAAINGFSEID